MFNGLFNFNKPLCLIGNLYIILLLARAILSWFPLSHGSPLIPVVRFLNTITEPVLAPFRRIIPPAGGFDISFLVVFIILQVVVSQIICRL